LPSPTGFAEEQTANQDKKKTEAEEKKDQ